MIRATPVLCPAFLSLPAIGVLAVGTTVCAQDSAKQQAPDSREISGFLEDYFRLVPDAKNGDLLLYEKRVRPEEVQQDHF